ncbi:hypothetical protein GCM10017674_51170 [Streptomyces gardneri]|uniref:Transposase n=1 Tax=Streptomyces gardneri TaxID=66892 RepID=A0A4Y3RES2_9ACTN|nr:hypothetical protein SGA01_14540 [Streptomyces gardneri]GHH08587.1 hypothetical protein GCM10017674_51170 [Streptomyces gardneri]
MDQWDVDLGVSLTDAQWARIEPILPEDYGAGFWDLTAGGAERGIVRAHQHAAGARKKGPQWSSRTIT